MPGSKPKAIPFGEIEWSRPEWADDNSEALTAVVEGYEFEIGPSPEQKKKWDWSIRATASVSETPELIDSGTAASKSGAQYACKERFNQHRLKEWQRQRLEHGDQIRAQREAKAPTPTEEDLHGAGQPTAAGMLQAVEEQVAKPPKRSRKTKQTADQELVAA